MAGEEQMKKAIIGLSVIAVQRPWNRPETAEPPKWTLLAAA